MSHMFIDGPRLPLNPADYTTVYVSAERCVLVTHYADGTVTVATRDSEDAVWGPPTTVFKETR